MDTPNDRDSAGAGAGGQRAGVCRICGCTDLAPCVDANGLTCAWVDAGHTLCDNLECIAQVPMNELEQLRPNLEAT